MSFAERAVEVDKYKGTPEDEWVWKNVNGLGYEDDIADDADGEGEEKPAKRVKKGKSVKK